MQKNALREKAQLTFACGFAGRWCTVVREVVGVDVWASTIEPILFWVFIEPACCGSFQLV